MKRSTPLVFNSLALLVAQRGDDPKLRAHAAKNGQAKHYETVVDKIDGGTDLAKAAAAAFEAFGRDGKAAAAAILTLDKLSWIPEQREGKRAGPPDKWGRGNKLYAWLAVESVHRADKKAEPQISLISSIDREFRRLGRKPWMVGAADEQLKLTKHTAKKYHTEGARILRNGHPGVWARWEKFAERETGHVIAARGKKLPRF
jgi:hypothetical protein